MTCYLLVLSLVFLTIGSPFLLFLETARNRFLPDDHVRHFEDLEYGIDPCRGESRRILFAMIA